MITPTRQLIVNYRMDCYAELQDIKMVMLDAAAQWEPTRYDSIKEQMDQLLKDWAGDPAPELTGALRVLADMDYIVIPWMHKIEFGQRQYVVAAFADVRRSLAALLARVL